jgi:hypothetical protein
LIKMLTWLRLAKVRLADVRRTPGARRMTADAA